MSNLIPNFNTRFDRDIDDLFRTFFTYAPANKRGTSLSPHPPAANVAATNEGYVIEVAAPGFSRGDFKIDVENNVLTVTGTSYGAEDKETVNYNSREFSCSSFTRSWSLPEGVNAEGVTAGYNAGILNISVPVENTGKKKFSVAVE